MIGVGPSTESRKIVRNFTRDTIEARLKDVDGAIGLSGKELKMMLYSLLLGPVVTGLTTYLDEFTVEKPNTPLPASDLIEVVGSGVASKVLAELQQNADLSTLVEAAKTRASRLEQPLAKTVYPLGQMVVSAAIGSANNMYDSAAASALVARPFYNDLPRGDFLDAVKRSVSLPLARTMATLTWQPVIDEGIFQSATSRIDPLLVYNQEKQEVVLAKPIAEWPDKLNISGQIAATVGDIKPGDEHLGCPISFAPRLVNRYYEHMVDMIETHDAWPAILAPK